MIGPVRAFRRFWPVLVVGGVVAVLAVVASMYRLPSLEKRSPATYTATAKLLVTGTRGPYMRSAVTTQTDATATTGDNPASQTRTAAPDLTPFVRAANLYPLLVESDQVQRFREKRFGVIENSTVTANAIYQVATPSRFRLSDIPVIQIFGTADSPKESMRLTQETASAFIAWVTKEQVGARISPRQRIVVEEIARPKAKEIVVAGGTPIGLVGLVFVAVFAVFAGLTLVLHRIRPETDSATAEAADEPESIQASRPARQSSGPDAVPVAPVTPVAQRTTLTLGSETPQRANIGRSRG